MTNEKPKTTPALPKIYKKRGRALGAPEEILDEIGLQRLCGKRWQLFFQ